MMLAALRREYRPAPPLAAALALLLLARQGDDRAGPVVPSAAVGHRDLFGVGGLALALWRDRTAVDGDRLRRPRRAGADRARGAARAARPAGLGRA